MSTNGNYSYGVHYTPSSTFAPNLTVNELKAKGIRYIRLQWTDLSNCVRFRVIPISHFSKILASPRPSVSLAKAGLGLIFISVAKGFSAVGEYLYVPDLSSFRICPYAPGHAVVMGWFEEKIPVHGLDGNPTLKVGLCPRATLRRVVEYVLSFI